MPLNTAGLRHLLAWDQDGVVSRRQILELGGTDNDIERMVRRREIAVAHPGVYVDHTGPLTRAQREWVAVLACWPAALAEESALPGSPTRVVVVAIEADQQRRRPPPWVRVRRTAHLADRVRPGSCPPRVELEHATIDVMARKLVDDDVAGAFTTLAEVCHTRRTDAGAIATALDARDRVRCRTMMRAMLVDLRDGACSVLERGYLHRVERAHGLPRGTRQVTSRATGQPAQHDVRYDDLGVEVELDGRAFHDNARARDTDARRDLAELVVSDVTTARVTYGMVYRATCWTAWMIARLLRRNGWTGRFEPCARCPRDIELP